MVDFIVATPVYSKFKVNYTSVGHKILTMKLALKLLFRSCVLMFMSVTNNKLMISVQHTRTQNNP